MCIKNILFKIFLTGWMSFLLASCIDEHYTYIREEPLPDGMVRVELYSNLDDFEYPTTRATADETTVSTTPMVIVFEGANDAAVFSEAVQTTHQDNKTTAILSENVNPCIIMVVSSMPGNKFFNGTTEEDFTAQEIMNALTGKTLAQAEQLLMTTKLSSPIQASRPFPNATDLLPMSGIINLPSIDVNTSIGTSTSKLILKRAVAKASVNVESSLDGTFRLVGAAVINVPRNTSVYRIGSLPTPASSELCNYLATSSGDRVGDMAPASNNSTASNPLYIYECSDATGTALIINAEYDNMLYYYKLVFYHQQQEVLLSVERNNNYVFTITSPERGYDTMEEAIDGPPSNIHYEITVTDAYAHDMISNGQYYLGVSNSHIEIYDKNTITLSSAVMVTTDAHQGMGISTASVTCTGGISLVSPSNSQLTLAPSAGSVGTTDITVTVPASVTDATITLQIGTLSKDITIVRRQPMGFTGYLELPETDYVHCEIPGTSGNNWITVSHDGESGENGTYTRPEPGKLFLLAAPNVAESGATARQGELFISRGDTGGSEGRTKVYLTQEPLNTGTTGPDVPNRSYVGAFWRAGQTGERLIRLFYESGAEGSWSAAVISGHEWIKLDTNSTDDPGVTWNYMENPADMNTHDQTYQVTGNARAVGGTMQATSNSYLYFRIGLKSRYIPTAEEPARYGLVLISYNNGEKYTPLYIRQGEGDDFLMRPGDPAPNGAISTRTKAVKYSPYNLTSKEYIDGTKTGGQAVSSHSQLAAKGGVFTEYPSQAGAYFQWASQTYPRYAWHPANPSTGNEINGWSNAYHTTYWDALTTTHETCPSTYRRPNDGSTSGPVNTPPIADSEQRQSLWLNPETSNTNNLQNSVWGYLADGFFDRYNIVTLPNGWPYSAVSTSTYKVAYIGRLFFNPNNYASIFFPAAGIRLVDTGALDANGAYGEYWNSSAQSIHNGRRLFFRQTGASSSDISRDMAYPIRCVYDPTAVEQFVEVTPPTAQILTMGGTGSFTVKTNAPSWSYTITYSGGAGSSGWLNVTSGHVAGTAIPGSTAGTVVHYSAPINVSKAQRVATITVTVADGSRSGTHTTTQLYNIAEMFAKSNIVLRPDNTLDFATTQAENTEIPACMQGLQFRYGSLLGINANTTTSTNDWSASHVVFAPEEYPYFPWVYSYSLIPYHTSFTSNVTDDFVNSYGPNGYDAPQAVGDICRYISKQQGWTKGNWRMPTSAELALLVSGSKYKQMTGTWSTQSISNNPTTWKGMGVVTSGWWLGYDTTGSITSPPETTIFLPANGSRINIGSMSNHGTLGGYWSTSGASTSSCNYLYLGSSNALSTTTGRDYATGVRCILDH